MMNKFDTEEFTATDLRIALNEIFPEASYGAIPAIELVAVLKAYLAFDDGALAEAREALAANVSDQQHCEV